MAIKNDDDQAVQPKAEAPQAPSGPKTQKQLLAEQQAANLRMQEDKAERLVEQLTSKPRKPRKRRG